MHNQSKFQIINIIALVIFCFALGELTAILLTGLFYGVSFSRISEILEEPSGANRSLLLSMSFLSALFRFIVFPGLYLLLTNKTSLRFLQSNGNVHLVPLALSILLVLALMPCTSILIDLNANMKLPTWLSEMEAYFRAGEEKALHLTNTVMTFADLEDLALVVFIVAIIPGIAEEFLFRGIVQSHLQRVFKSPHYAIAFSAMLFSLLHFQFYGFIPRMALGLLFGYIFYWSRNILYPIVMHITNNLVGVLGAYFFGSRILDAQSGSAVSMLLIFPSLTVSALMCLILKKRLLSH